MSKNILGRLTLVVAVAAALFLSGCGGDSRKQEKLRIARDIQMSMVPNVFPSVEGLDMYASMTPAKEVGGGAILAAGYKNINDV